MKKKLDPITEGDKIFKLVTEKVEWKSTKSIVEASNFLKSLIIETDSYVIVDFLDSGNWDSIQSVDIDEENGFLMLNWHDYRVKTETEFEKEVRSYAFPASLYSSLIKFRELRIVETKRFPIFLIRGYALKDKEIKKYLSKDTTEFKILDNNDNFSKLALCKKDNLVETYTCLNTPIFSLIIIPKNAGVPASYSQKVLYEYNLNDSISRINSLKTELENESLEDEDIICEKANSVRRIFEYVLKVELCYRYRQVNVKKEYSDLMLGDLMNLIKKFHDESINDFLTRITIWSNELSHDSGKPIKREKAFALCYMTIVYIELLKLNISINPYPEE